jgi:hypothetical protein
MKTTTAKTIDFRAFAATHRPFDNMAGMVNSLRRLQTVWSWGAHAWTRMNDCCLRFTVHGHHHKGHVYLAVNGSDLFDIVLTSNRGTIKTTMTDIYVDCLVDTIDREVERIPAYVN